MCGGGDRPVVTLVSRPTVDRPVAAHSTYGCALSNPFVLLLNTGRVESIPINHSFNIHRCTHSQQNMSFIRYKTRGTLEGTHTNAGIWGKAIAFRRVRPCPEDRPPDQPVVTWMSRPTTRPAAGRNTIILRTCMDYIRAIPHSKIQHRGP